VSDDLPTLTSGILALVAATGGAVFLSETQLLAYGMAGAGAGALVLVLGISLARSWRHIPGTLLALVGFAGYAGGAAFGALNASSQLHLAVVGPAFLGILFVALAVAPLRGSGSRRFTKIACWLVFIGVVLGAGMEYSEAYQALGATVAAALVWDLGENSISLGRQVGRSSWSLVNETTHAFGSVFVGAISAGAAYTVFDVSTGGRPLSTVVMMLVAIVLLVAFLHR